MVEQALAREEGRDPEGGPRGRHSWVTYLFNHLATFYYRPSLPGPAADWGEAGRTHSPSQISQSGGSRHKICSDGRRKGLAGSQHRDVGV